MTTTHQRTPVLISGFKKLWLAALRGGQYKQARGKLRKSNDHDTFCCLGVLQDIVAPEDWRQDDIDKIWFANSTAGHLCPKFRHRVGLSSDNTHTLIQMNDGIRDNKAPYVDEIKYKDGHEPKSFKEIADFIEEHM